MNNWYIENKHDIDYAGEWYGKTNKTLTLDVDANNTCNITWSGFVKEINNVKFKSSGNAYTYDTSNNGLERNIYNIIKVADNIVEISFNDDIITFDPIFGNTHNGNTHGSRHGNLFFALG